ncbi:MAG: acyl transferase [Bacteroidota bacterium]
MNTLKDKFSRESKQSGDINQDIRDRVFNLKKIEDSINTFRYQASGNPIYTEYLCLIGCNPDDLNSIDSIPFLPIEFFKTHRVVTGAGTETRIFKSSGTTGNPVSSHYILDEQVYIESFTRCFRLFFGDPSSYCLLAQLPSYLERQDSSLVFMADHLIRLTGHPLSGFYLDNLDELAENLRRLEKSGQKTILMGVSFALLDFADQFPMHLTSTRIIETGGMKGRRQEITRDELHEILQKAFRVNTIGSEYGMTELLSQAWSTGSGLFRTPPWMRIVIRDPYDPLRNLPAGKTGGINIIDLANYRSCSFIQTQDLGRLHDDGSFEVLGRMDNSDVRGCNLFTIFG